MGRKVVFIASNPLKENDMKNRKHLAIAALAGITLGGLSITAASAQSYGSSDATSTNTVEADTVEADANDSGSIVLIQDEAETETEENEGEGRRRGGCKLEAAAAAIGIDEADLKSALESGDSIADVAEANGVSADAVIDAMVEAKTERIAEKVSEGRITQEEADEKLADLESRITDRVNGVEEAPEA